MSNTNLELARVEIHHEYYALQGPPPFLIWPSRETRRLLAHYGIRFRERGSGFTLHYPAREAAPDVFRAPQPIGGPLVLSFALAPTNLMLSQYLWLPEREEASRFFHFHNLQSESGDPPRLSQF